MDQTQRLIMKGLLEEKRERLHALKIKIDRLIKDINIYTYRYNSTDIQEIQDEHLIQAAHELQETLREARALERELRRAGK